MTEVVITLKAGKDFSDPWIVLHAETVGEGEAMLDQASASLLAKTRMVAKQFQDADAAAVQYVAQQTGATVVEATGPQATAGAAPWDAPAAPAAPPWGAPQESAGPAPFGAPMPNPFSAKPLIKLPYVKDPESADGQKQKQFKDYFYQQRNKLVWSKERKGFEFTSTPSPELMAFAKQWAPSIGGSVEG